MSAAKAWRIGAAIILVVGITGTATASLAQTNPYARSWDYRYGNARAQSWDYRYGDARAQAFYPRAQAIRECTKAENQYTETTWGNMEIYVYRACMYQHGQPE